MNQEVNNVLFVIISPHPSINRVLKQGLLDKPFSQFYVFQYNTIMDSLTKSADFLVLVKIVELILAVILI